MLKVIEVVWPESPDYDYAYIFFALSLLKQVLTFSVRFADVCATTHWKRGIEKFVLLTLIYWLLNSDWGD